MSYFFIFLGNKKIFSEASLIIYSMYGAYLHLVFDKTLQGAGTFIRFVLRAATTVKLSQNKNGPYIYVTLSHLRSKESTGIYEPGIPGLFPLPRVHLRVDQRVQRNNFPRIHLNVHWCTSGCIPVKLFL